MSVIRFPLGVVILGALASLAGCATHDRLPDPRQRMTILGWYLDPAHPKEAVSFTFEFPAESRQYHSETVVVGHRLHQYRLDAIDEAVPPLNLPQVHVTDLDTNARVLLRQDQQEPNARIFTEEATLPPAKPH